MVDLEVQVSVSVEDVFRCEVSDPVWIQIIVDYLSLSPEAPHCCGQIRLSSFEGTHGIWQSEQVYIIQVTGFDKQLDILTDSIL